MTVCATCKGAKVVKCPRCYGKGSFSGILTGTAKCENCGGTGYIQCNTCKGKGSV